VADNNNDRAGNIPAKPNKELKKLECLVGTWKESGEAEGTSTYEWMEGGFYLIQRFDTIIPDGRRVKGVEYIGYDEDTKTLRTHLMDNIGSNFAYTYDIIEGKDGEEATLMIWFGDKGSDNFYKGTISKDGKTIRGGWQWPGGGFEALSTRID
jgi:Protein of unknown function (DUF1579)